jgi:hypothetical protein
MANPTTNYGFVLPTPSDLVTDLPADFEVALQGVDTQMKTNADAAIAKSIVDAKGDIVAATAADTPARLAVGANGTVLTADSTEATGLKWAAPSSGALTLINTTTFSAQSSQSFNNVFTSTYTNYKIIITGLYLTTGTSDFRMRMRASGTDNTNAAYIYSGWQSTNTTLSRYGSQETNFYFCDNNSLNAADENSIEISLFRPALAKFTTGNWVYNGTNNSNADGFAGQMSHAVATAYDGFTIYPGASTLYGTVSIYGWSK